MKTKLLFTALLSFNFYLLSSQVPQGFNYQAIARDNSGNPIVNQALQVKLAVMGDSLGSYIIWEELFASVTTNAYGLFTVPMGKGSRQNTSTVMTFSAINWNYNPLFVRTQVFYQGAWKIMGSSRILSVPYSLLSNNSLTANGFSGMVPHIGVTGNSAVMDSALFVVRNNKGQIIFAVYNEGVRIYVDDGAVKGTTKGGFAVGGFGSGKTNSQPLLVVDPDSIRMYINDKLVKGNTKGGFAIGGFGGGKGASDFFDVATDTTGIINPAQNRILWYPLKNAFLTGNIIIEKKDSVGINSFSSGYLSRAKGAYSQAMGYQAISRSNYSSSIGKNSLATGLSSYAFGDHATASGTGSYAFGTYATATGNQSFALGSVGVDTLGNPTGKTIASGWGAFALGFGSVASQQGSFTFGVGDTASGPFSTAMGYQSAARGWFNTSMGLATKSDGVASTSTGWQTQVKSSGWAGMANGCLTVSNNWAAAAFGDRTTASGHTSFATGYKTTASAHLSSTFGDNSAATGDGAIAMGHFTTAQAYGSLAIGRYNLIAGGSTTWNFWDPVFVVGNGSSTSLRSNAFTVYNSGIGDFGSFINLCSKTTDNRAIMVNNKEALWFDGTYYSWGYGGDYNVFAHSMAIGTTASPGIYTLYVNGLTWCMGGVWQGSDIRWKKNLKPVENVMPGILALSAYTYNWRKEDFPDMRFGDETQVGLVAQDVEKVFPNLVKADGKGYKSVAYDRLTALLVEGIKAQQKQIDQQKHDNEELRAELKALKEAIDEMKSGSRNK